MRSRLSSHPLLAYFILTYAITWLFTIPLAYCWNTFLGETFVWWLIFFLPGAYGPTIAALIITRILKGKSGVRHLLRRLLIWRVHWQWYLAVILLPLLWVLAGMFLSQGMNAFAEFRPLELLTAFPLWFLVALPFGPLAEELGWRGFALPRLQEHYSPLISSLILGVIWTFWHTPMFWFAGAAIPSFMDLSLYSVGLYLLRMLPLAILFTLIFNHTRGSVLIAILFHTTYNASENIIFSAIPEPSDAFQLEVYYWTLALIWFLAILSVIFLRRKIWTESHFRK